MSFLKVDSIQQFRYLGCCESSNLIFGSDRNGNKPVVITLQLHLEGQQEVHYASNTTPAAFNQTPTKVTKLDAFFLLCQVNPTSNVNCN